VMFLYHYLIAQMFCGSLCMSYLGAVLRNIYQGWPLDWCQRPHMDAVLLFGMAMFSSRHCLSGTSFVLPTKN
jgi:hypothetical protein